jgi:hypothetical protein
MQTHQKLYQERATVEKAESDWARLGVSEIA